MDVCSYLYAISSICKLPVRACWYSVTKTLPVHKHGGNKNQRRQRQRWHAVHCTMLKKLVFQAFKSSSHANRNNDSLATVCLFIYFDSHSGHEPAVNLLSISDVFLRSFIGFGCWRLFFYSFRVFQTNLFHDSMTSWNFQLAIWNKLADSFYETYLLGIAIVWLSKNGIICEIFLTNSVEILQLPIQFSMFKSVLWRDLQA